MSRARQKGTRWETELLQHLRTIWPHAERAPLRGAADRGDFTSCNQWLLEAKSTTVPRFLEWARACRRKAAGNPWAILWHGDRRGPDGQPLVLLQLEHFLALAANETPRPVIWTAPTLDDNEDALLAEAARRFFELQHELDGSTGERQGTLVLRALQARHDCQLLAGVPCGCDDDECPGLLGSYSPPLETIASPLLNGEVAMTSK